MSARDRKNSRVIGVVTILILLAWVWVFSQISVGTPTTVISLFLMVFTILGLMIFDMYKSSSKETQAVEPMVDPTTSPVYYEETIPEDIESEKPLLSCPNCGYMNPGDAYFCIRCGQDLRVSDEVARY